MHSTADYVGMIGGVFIWFMAGDAHDGHKKTKNEKWNFEALSEARSEWINEFWKIYWISHEKLKLESVTETYNDWINEFLSWFTEACNEWIDDFWSLFYWSIYRMHTWFDKDFLLRNKWLYEELYEMCTRICGTTNPKNKDESHSKQNIQIMLVMHALLLRFGMW